MKRSGPRRAFPSPGKDRERTLLREIERLSILNRAARLTAGNLSLQEMSDRLVEILTTAMPCDAFFSACYDARRRRLMGICAYDTIDGFLEPVKWVGGEIDLRDRDYGPAMLEGKPVCFQGGDGSAAAGGVMRFGDRNRPSASKIYAPMMSSGRLVGVLSVQSYRENAYRREDVDLLAEVARQVGPSHEAVMLSDQLRASEKQFRTLFENLPDPVFVEDYEGRVLDVNPAACRLHGMAREELIGANVLDLVPPARREEVAACFSNWVSGSATLYRGESLGANGRVVPVEIRGSRLEYGGTPAVLLLLRDISERIEAEEALRRRESLLRGLHLGTEILLSAEDEVPFRAFLERLAPAVGANRAAVFLAKGGGPPGEMDLRPAAEWCSEEMTPLLLSGNPAELGVESILARWPRVLMEEGVLYGHARDFPEEEREFLRRMGVRSLLALPLVVNGVFRGFVGYSHCRTEHEWEPAEIEFLRTAAGNLSQAMHRIGAKKALAESEQTYRDAIEIADGVPYRIRYEGDPPVGVYEFIGEGIERLMGFPISEFSHEILVERTEELRVVEPEETRDLEKVRRAFFSGRISRYQADLRVRTADGGSRWLSDAAVPLVDPATGRVTGSLGILQDITARKEIEESLRRYALVYESMGEGVLISTPEGVTIDLNPAAERLFGRTRGEMIGRTAEFLHPPEIARSLSETILRALDADGVWRGEVPIIRPSGEQRFLHVVVSCLRNERGERIGNIGIHRDITEQKRVEEALRRSEEKFSRAFHASPDGMVIVRLSDGSIKDVNESFLRAIGRSREEVIGGTAREIGLWADSQTEARFGCVLENSEGVTGFEANFRTADGGAFPALISGRKTEIDGEPCLLIVARDISHLRKAEEERKRLEERIQQTQKLESLGILAGGIAHDFNNLLTGILGNASLALLEVSPHSSLRESLQMIEIAAKRAAELTNQMLAYSGGGRFHIEKIDLTELVREMAYLLDASISKRAIMNFDLNDRLPLIEADATQLRQIVMNLITNASDALGERRGLIAIRTDEQYCSAEYLAGTYLREELEPGRYVYLEVSDTGKGLDEATREKMFDPFFTTKATGRGLGLAAVLGIVRGHRGAIEVTSRPGQGTTFKILFPACADAVRGSSAGPKRPAARVCTGTILVVDDEETVRTLAGRCLERSGFSILTAASGDEATAIFSERSNDIDAIVLDMTMPGMGGEDVYRELRRIRPDVRVLFSSGYSEELVPGHLLESGRTSFIQKPYRADDLVERICSLLGRDGEPCAE